jgi:3-hydroxybutyryl-CoA dehydrogenase
MSNKDLKRGKILVWGNDKLAFSITVCLLLAEYNICLYSENAENAEADINQHAVDIDRFTAGNLNLSNLEIKSELGKGEDFILAIAITDENLKNKLGAIEELEKVVSDNVIIAINTESISLGEIQKGSKNPERIIAANWTNPAHTTYFLEIIYNNLNQEELVKKFYSIARQYWGKDPYIVKANYSIRARMMSALIREAFYLVENGYVSFEDIDRACRNDAGYYLPFAGNFRYMDLMGTYIYGLVMKDMNPDLSKERHIPAFFTNIISSGGQGMENRKGFYAYEDSEVQKWNELSRIFSYQIQKIIAKYPFASLEKNLHPENETKSIA